MRLSLDLGGQEDPLHTSEDLALQSAASQRGDGLGFEVLTVFPAQELNLSPRLGPQCPTASLPLPHTQD